MYAIVHVQFHYKIIIIIMMQLHYAGSDSEYVHGILNSDSFQTIANSFQVTINYTSKLYANVIVSWVLPGKCISVHSLLCYIYKVLPNCAYYIIVIFLIVT